MPTAAIPVMVVSLKAMQLPLPARREHSSPLRCRRWRRSGLRGGLIMNKSLKVIHLNSRAMIVKLFPEVGSSELIYRRAFFIRCFLLLFLF
jgi:hypothetical protein